MKPGLPVVSVIVLPTIAASLLALPADARAQPAALQTEQTEQEACGGIPTGQDVFSVGEVRTSILRPEEFQRLNGPEWVLMDGRQLTVQTELSPHLLPDAAENADSTSASANDSETRDVRPKKIPDARGRFLRMANNGACVDLRGDDETYRQCTADHDPDGDRSLGAYQPDAFRAHQHGYNDIYFSEHSSLVDGAVDVLDDGEHNNWGSNQADQDNSGYGWDRTTVETGGSETRSKNVAVNFYVKICNCRTSNCR